MGICLCRPYRETDMEGIKTLNSTWWAFCMKNLDEYRKYYHLEQYLFKEVSNNFKSRKSLTNEEFFAIVMWKRKPSAIKIARSIQKSSTTVHALTEKVYQAATEKEKIESLLEIKQIGIAIASAVLTVCYPEDFTVLDYRALNSLRQIEGAKCEEQKLPQKAESFEIEDYLSYNGICKKVWKNYCESLRDFDRALWAMDWYGGEHGLKEVAKSLR